MEIFSFSLGGGLDSRESWVVGSVNHQEFDTYVVKYMSWFDDYYTSQASLLLFGKNKDNNSGFCYT